MPRFNFSTFIFILLFIPFMVFAQETPAGRNSTPISVEIQNIERALNEKNITPQLRQNNLLRLARLHQLSGNIEAAAKSWLEAAVAIPGRVDEDALLACAYCLAAMGEWERAAAALEPLLPKNIRARFLNFAIEAWRTGNTGTLVALANNPEYFQMKSEIYFLIWKINGDNVWKQRLIDEFPHGPETRIAVSQTESVAVKPRPFWLFLDGRETVVQMENMPAQTAVSGQPPVPSVTIPQPPSTATISPQISPQPPSTAVPPSPAVASPQSSSPAASPQPPPSVSPSSQTAATASGAARLQTGIFGREGNARAQMDNLVKAGFSSAVEKRIVNGNEMWAVIVYAQDPGLTANALRNAGFETFILR